MFANGLNLAFNAGFLTQIIKSSLDPGLSKDDENTKIIYIFLILGVAESICGYTMGKIIDKISRSGVIILNYAFTAIALGYSFVAI